MVKFTLSAFGAANGIKYSVHESDSDFPQAGFIYSDLRVARKVCRELNDPLEEEGIKS